VLDSEVAGAGGDPHSVKTVAIGFNAVPSRLAGRVAAATAFWSNEGVTIERRRPGFHIFRVDDYGAPPYPELVLCATGATVGRDPALARAVVRALARGYRITLTDPRASAADLESSVPGLDPRLVEAELGALELAFETSDHRFGALEPATPAARRDGGPLRDRATSARCARRVRLRVRSAELSRKPRMLWSANDVAIGRA
jgi:ABC-type nitrate/sulfonate/bicarbonate transport system substrate-binding protein